MRRLPRPSHHRHRRMARYGLLAAVLTGAAGCSPAPPAADVATDPPPPAAAPAPVDYSGPLSFTEHIAPILYDNCTDCHRPGQSGPFSVLDYDEVRRRGPLIATATETGYMPPWLPEQGYGTFAGERRLSDDEIGAIQRWVADGMPEGDPDVLPAAPEFVEGWQLGEPDLVVKMPLPYTLRAGTGDVFRNFVIPSPLDDRRWIRAVELRPGNAKIVHHALITIDETASSRRLEALDPDPGYYVSMELFSAAQSPDGHFLGWTPGRNANLGRDDIAWQLRPATDLVLQLHMLPREQPEEVQAEIGLYFTDRPPRRESYVLRLGPQNIDIPPGESDYLIEESWVLPVDLEAFAVYPHAHYLGKEMKGFATLPDGSVEWLVWIKDWDFMRQDWYMYAEPVDLPRGTTLTMQFSYDNSADNAANPSSPPRRVRLGPNSADEMGDLWVQVVLKDRRDLAVLDREFMLKEVNIDLSGVRRVVEEEPGSPGDRYDLARLLEALGQIDEAVLHYRVALRLDPTNAAAHLNLGNLLLGRGQTRDAVLHYSESLRLRPDYAEALNGLGMALMQQGAVEQAEAVLRQAVALSPSGAWEAHDNLGSALAAQGRFDEAVAAYRRAIAIEPNIPSVHNNLGGALGSMGNAVEAADEFRLVLLLQPDHPGANNNLGMALEQMGDIETAISHYRRALELRPDYEQARANLNRALTKRR